MWKAFLAAVSAFGIFAALAAIAIASTGCSQMYREASLRVHDRPAYRSTGVCWDRVEDHTGRDGRLVYRYEAIRCP